MHALNTTDLFGKIIADVNTSTVKNPRKSPAKVVINRRVLWSAKGDTFAVKELNEDVKSEALATADTYSDNSAIEKLEVALGLSPVIRNGKWVTDALGFKYQRKGSPFKGERVMGDRGSIVRDMNMILIINTARNAVEAAFTDPCSWLVLNSISVLTARLRMMDATEDPNACLRAFMGVMLQHDFIDNSRKGGTIRNIAKRDRIREVRKQRSEAKEKAPVSKSLMKDLELEDTNDFADADDYGDGVVISSCDE